MVRLAIAGVLGLLPVLVLEALPPLRRQWAARKAAAQAEAKTEAPTKAETKTETKTVAEKPDVVAEKRPGRIRQQPVTTTPARRTRPASS